MHNKKNNNVYKYFIMALLKEDGSLDVDWINSLPIEEHVKVFESLTKKQYKEYWSKAPLNESHTTTHAVKVDKPIEEWGVDAKKFINQ